MRKYALIILVLFFSTIGFSQEEDSYVFGDSESSSPTTKSNDKGGFDWDRVTVGGGLGLTFGSYTIIEIAPTFGYYLTDNILAGIGGSYTYYKESATNFSSSVYGSRVFAEYLFETIPFLAHAEVELINLQWTAIERKNIVNTYVGGGLKQQVGGRSYFYILILYNLNETKESYIFQPNPIIRGGIAIGL